MDKPLVCLTLTGKTLQENVETLEKYSRYVDIAELRVDYLSEEEQLYVRRFPAMVNVPCILTIRRVSEGGKYSSSDFSRTALFGRALAFADQNPSKNFAYVDFEEDFHVSGLHDAALAFGVKIIRSVHDFENPVVNIRERCEKMRRTGYEIPKIAFMPKTLSDVTRLFKEAEQFTDFEHILCAMGPLGTPSRILAGKLHSYLTYTSPKTMDDSMKGIGHIDPVTLSDLYNFKNIDENTKLCAVTGYPLKVSSSPLIHNSGYRTHGMNRVFIPLPSTSAAESLEFAEQVGITGMAVTVPYKEDVMRHIEEIDSESGEIGACNTVVREDDRWVGKNTDAEGFRRALVEFLGVEKLRHRKVAIIGAGGAAHAVAYAIKQLGGKACIFNRTLSTAKELAERFGFEYAPLSPESTVTLEKYSDIIIQTTNVGMNSKEPPSKENNPIWFYQFKGTENLFDIVYDPETTPVMAVAKSCGCNVSNGFPMLKYQGYKQFYYFTGVEYEGTVTK